MISEKRMIVVLVVFALVGPLTAAASVGPEARLMGKSSIDPQLGDQIPLDLAFVNSQREPVRLSEVVRERPVILHLVYYECPMLCKLAGDGLLRSLNRLDLEVGESFDIITLSFDPTEGAALSARAKQVALEHYDRPGAARGWHFLSGDAAPIEQLTDAVGFHPVWDEARGQYAHPSGIFVLSPDGVLSRFLSGVDFRPRDLRLAILEASDGKISSVSDQLLMLCYQYDPTTGKYGFAILSALRAAGVLTVTALAVGVAVMLRRERAKKKLTFSNEAE